MKIAVGGIFHETNTFAPERTTMRHFRDIGMLLKGDEIFENYKGTTGSLGGIIDRSKELNIELVPALYAEATPSGIVDHQVFQQLVNDLVNQIDPNVEGILLVLHGAMATTEEQDAETYLIKKIRDEMGNIPIVCTVDLHANVSLEMVELTQCIVGYDTYPHVDYYPRAQEATTIIHDVTGHKIQPTACFIKPMAMPVVQKMFTDVSPMKDLIDLALDFEKDKEVINVTVTGGFPYADVREAGMGFIVTTNNNKQLAKTLCETLEKKFIEIKEQFIFENLTPEEGVKMAKECNEYPVILVDSSDNIGGGSSGDGTDLLKQFIDQDIQDGLIILRDTDAISECLKQGIGKRVSLEVGAKTDELHGTPVLISGKVIRISDGHYRSERTGEKKYMGKTVVLDCEGIFLVLTEERVPAFDLEAVESLGVKLHQLKYIVVKGAIQWKSSYGKIAKASIEVDCHGVTSSNLKRFNYKNVPKTIFPLNLY